MNAPRPAAVQALQARWQKLAAREQNLLLGASAVLSLALLWWLALAPALATLRSAPARHAQLDAQLQQMQALQPEAQQLQNAPQLRTADARRRTMQRWWAGLGLAGVGLAGAIVAATAATVILPRSDAGWGMATDAGVWGGGDDVDIDLGRDAL